MVTRALLAIVVALHAIVCVGNPVRAAYTSTVIDVAPPRVGVPSDFRVDSTQKSMRPRAGEMLVPVIPNPLRR